MNIIKLRQRARFRKYSFDFDVRCGLYVQGDQDIANQAGAAFRSDLNNELKALAQMSSGASAPGTTYAYQLWADTTTNLLKQRNAANSAWVVRGTLAETMVASRSSNTILAGTDRGKLIVATATFTQTLTAAATLGDGWYCLLKNEASTAVIVDPNGGETINGRTTIVIEPGQCMFIFCNGSGFYAFSATSAHAQAIEFGNDNANGATSPGFVASQTANYGTSTSKNVTITGASVSYGLGMLVIAGMNAFASDGHSRALWMVGGDLTNDQIGITELVRTNSGNTSIGALSSGSGSTLSFTMANNSGSQNAQGSVTIIGGNGGGPAPIISFS